MRLSPLLSLALLTACAVPEENFADAFGRAACARYSQCEKDTFEEVYDDIDACADDVSALMELGMDAADLLNQEYDGTEGAECIRDIRTTSCDDFSFDELVCDVYG